MKYLLILLSTVTILTNCKINKQVIKDEPTEVIALPEMTVQSDHEENIEITRYQASNTRNNDLIHTKLAVKFDWEKQHLLGKAELTFTPYFYSTNELVLDAKGFDIHSITMGDSLSWKMDNKIVETAAIKDLKYTYDGLKIVIDLGKTYTRNDAYTINIKYTAKPNELKASGSSAITDEKGLYFINPLGTEPNKMPQIWTQGETESSSCWFPTIDSPNEKTTQELSITVKDKFKTLSNGKLISSKKNADGTRTDFWKQDLMHAPYLFMMAVGEFDITQDSWTRPDGSKMEVNYYTEAEFTPYAKDIFGKTPKMIQFFSDKLGVTYPWHKYNQIVVRDYVSGAMENTTAVIHGDFLYQTERELLDSDNESIIAHELFHHWFGDLVTAESWSNLTINESFANYSQYLWDEFEHGREEADMNAFGEVRGYFLSSTQGGYHDLVNFEYENEMEMFDGHSYNKGGRILHMLRYYVGDDAFFTSLNHFLNKMKFKAAEAHDLRLSFEEVTGKDLNWFFNQWYFDKGHPILHYSQSYEEASKKLILTVEQRQNFNQFPVFQLPIEIDIYTANGKERKSIFLNQKNQSFEFETEKPLLVNFDAEKVILGKKTEDKTKEQWVYQLKNAPLYLDKKDALAQLKNSKSEEMLSTILGLLDESFYEFNNMGMSALSAVKNQQPNELKQSLLKLITNKKSSVRANGYKSLTEYYGSDEGYESLLEKGLQDKSYQVIGACLDGLASSNPSKAMQFAKGLEKEKSNSVKEVITDLYAEYGDKNNHDFFINAINTTAGFSKYGLLSQYSNYLLKLDEIELSKSIPLYHDVAKSSSAWWMKMTGYQGLISVKNRTENRIEELKTELSVTKEATKKSKIEREISEMRSQLSDINSLYNSLRQDETDQKIIDYLENM
jgi:aminopeptidase N